MEGEGRRHCATFKSECNKITILVFCEGEILTMFLEDMEPNISTQDYQQLPKLEPRHLLGIVTEIFQEINRVIAVIIRNFWDANIFQKEGCETSINQQAFTRT